MLPTVKSQRYGGAAAVADVLRHDLRTPALERPADHSGDKRSSMHRVSLTETQCRLLLAVVNAPKTPGSSLAIRARGLGAAENCEELLLWRVTKPNGCQYDRAECQSASQPRTIGKVLIANRQTIARRIVRACNELGITSVVVYTSVDAKAPYISEASEAYALNGLRPADITLIKINC